MRGRLYVVEGLDGVGKSTLSRGLAGALGAARRTTPSTALRAARGPFDAAYAAVPAASQLFYAAAVVEAAEELRALLAAGRDVVLDRYWCTTLAYAAAAGSPLGLAEVEALLPRADHTLYLHLDEPERARRLRTRGASALDRATLEDDRRAALERAYRSALRRPVAGRVHHVEVAGLDEAALLQRVLGMLRSAGAAGRPADAGPTHGAEARAT